MVEVLNIDCSKTLLEFTKGVPYLQVAEKRPEVPYLPPDGTTKTLRMLYVDDDDVGIELCSETKIGGGRDLDRDFPAK